MIADDFTLARVIHVVAVLFWIGGVAFVTLVLMPAVRAGNPPAERLAAFHRIEGRFAPQARLWVLLAGASGFWMTWRADLWERFADPRLWWMQAMVAIWLVFVAMLFVIEPQDFTQWMGVKRAHIDEETNKAKALQKAVK